MDIVSDQSDCWSERCFKISNATFSSSALSLNVTQKFWRVTLHFTNTLIKASWFMSPPSKLLIFPRFSELKVA